MFGFNKKDPATEFPKALAKISHELADFERDVRILWKRQDPALLFPRLFEVIRSMQTTIDDYQKPTEQIDLPPRMSDPLG